MVDLRASMGWQSILILRRAGLQFSTLFVLADALANAAKVFGSMRKAEKRRPVDLLTTSIGEKIVIQDIAEAELMMRVGESRGGRHE